MGRRAVKVKEESEKAIETDFLPKKDLLRIDEVASYFSVEDQTIRLWIAHGHLIAEKHRGTLRVRRQSVVECRMKNRLQYI
jgi:excisionase family DNA binding protein